MRNLAYPARFHAATALMLCIFVVQELSAQPSRWSGENISVEHLSTEQGLSSLSVNTIIQDRRGFIWIGTLDGLNKFDGENFRIYRNNPDDSTSLSNNAVWALFEDRDGVLWVGTHSGLNKYDPAAKSFRRYFHNPINPQTLSSNEITSIYEDRERTLWVGTSRGINKFHRNNETFEQLFPMPGDSINSGNNFIDAILEDAQNVLWVGRGIVSALGGGLSSLDRKSGTFTHFRHDDKNQYSLPNDWVTSLYEGRDGTLWVGTNGGVCTFNRTNNSFLPIPHSSANRLTIHRIFSKSVCEDRNGNIWFATWGSGIFRYDRKSKSIAQYTYNPVNPLGITSPTVMTLFFDRSGLLWVGTWRGGVNTVALKSFEHYHTIAGSQFLNNGALSFLEDRGDLYIGTFLNGLWKYNFSTKTAERIPLPPFQDSAFTKQITSSEALTEEQLNARHISFLRKDKSGAIWMLDINSCELFTFKPNFTASVIFRTPITLTGFREPFNCYLLDDDETIWVGSFSKLYHIDKKGNVLRTFNPEQHPNGISPGAVNALLRDRSGILWVGMSSGLHQFDEKSASFTKFQHVVNDSSSLSNNVVLNILEDHVGRLWIGTADGLNLFESTTEKFTRFTTTKGMAGKRIVSLQEDENGNIWLATNVGISQVNGITGIITNHNQSDGLPTVEYNRNSSIRRKNGEFLFGTTLGILAFHPDNVTKLDYVPQIVITGINKFNRPAQLSTSPELLREITFDHNENVFSISFSALSFEKYAFNQYAYKLEGFDQDWVYCGTKREAMYTNLDPGTYTFRVKGSNHDGIWNQAGASLSVIVRPAWWQTAWFTVLVWLSAISAVGGTVRIVVVRRLQQRISQLEQEKAIERDRARISQDLHDEIGSSLSEIAILSSLGKRKPKEAQVRLEEISERAASVIENLGEIVWAINPRNDTLDNLFSRIRRYTVNYLGLARIPCVCAAPDSIPSVPLSAEMRRNVFLVVKEALHNVVKYAHASQVSFDMCYLNDTVTIVVADDGRGFLLNEKMESGNGLGNMKRRMDDLGGSISIDTAPGRGTRIALKVVTRKVAPHKIPNSTD